MDEHVYRLGDRGLAVAEIRDKLVQLGLLDQRTDPAAADQTVFDADVEHAVRYFQQERGLSANGVVDAQTYRTLDEARWCLGDRLLTYQPAQPLTGDDVQTLQRKLLDLGYDGGRVDGIFGPATERAVREFQRASNLPADGTCGPATFKALDRAAPSTTAGGITSRRETEAIDRAGPRLPGKVVVIDPAHGGGDPGISANGIVEAEIVFDLASRIEGRLAATGVRPYLTRGRHNCPAEVDRALFANEVGADLVVSLHIDHHRDPQANGVATYYYGSALTGTGSAVGAKFAGLVQREIVARTDLLDARTHAKSWDLLRRTRMPAVQVELGYLTNAGDAARLSDPGFRDVVAEAIVVAIQRVYLPPDLDAPTGALRLSELTDIHQPT